MSGNRIDFDHHHHGQQAAAGTLQNVSVKQPAGLTCYNNYIVFVTKSCICNGCLQYTDDDDGVQKYSIASRQRPPSPGGIVSHCDSTATPS